MRNFGVKGRDIMINKSTGNMYPFVTHTWNTVKGKCPHECAYCYMKKWGEQPDLHFDEKGMKTDLGKGNFVFVGSSCDMFAEVIYPIWIFRTLDYCKGFDNRYLFQSKNPERIYRLRQHLPPNVVLGTTIESDRSYREMGYAPNISNRAHAMFQLSLCDIETMVTIEPIMDFDLSEMVATISQCHPKWVNIGANTYTKVKLPEPEPGKIKDLITALSEFTEVKIKKNLDRLLPE